MKSLQPKLSKLMFLAVAMRIDSRTHLTVIVIESVTVNLAIEIELHLLLLTNVRNTGEWES